MAINKILCCCGSGLGSSLIVHMNTEDVVKALGHPEIEVDHTTISDLDNILDKDELQQKLAERLA